MNEVKVEVRGAQLRKRDIELLLDFRWMVRVIPKFRRDEELLAAYRRRYDFPKSGTDLHPPCFVSDLESGQQRRGEEGNGYIGAGRTSSWFP
jgi:hypothetical protein